jgi:hypothetical protein
VKRILQISVLIPCLLVLMASSPVEPHWRMRADYVEACSCHLFCPCYFNKHAEHPHCEFNMAVKVREGHAGDVNLAGAKYWLTGDLGDEWGTNKKGAWVIVSFDPSTTKAQRDALAPIILKTYGLEWPELKVQEAPIEISQNGDIAEARLGDGTMAHMKLKREPGQNGQGVVLQNVSYFGAQKNDGFHMYKSVDHSANVGGHKFQYADRNAFLISIDVYEGAQGGMGSSK